MTSTVAVNTISGLHLRWTFTTSTGLPGTDITVRGVEAAFDAGKSAAEQAVDDALDAR